MSVASGDPLLQEVGGLADPTNPNPPVHL